MLDIGTDGPHNCPVPFFYPVILLKEGLPCHIRSSSPTTNLSAFIPLVSLCITHPSLAPSTRVFLLATNQVDNFCPVLFCVYRIRSILFFILSYSLTSLSTIWFVVGRFLAFSIPNPHRANRSFVILLYTSLAHCPRIHSCHCCSNLSTTSNSVHNYICRPEGFKGVSINLVVCSLVWCQIPPVTHETGPSDQGGLPYVCPAQPKKTKKVWSGNYITRS
jgi:hypothetical protein